MAIITWQEIANNLPLPQENKFVRETLSSYYRAVKRNIDYECNFNIPHIGHFKGKSGEKRLKAIKRHNQSKTRFIEKYKKKKQRLWAKQKFDSQCID